MLVLVALVTRKNLAKSKNMMGRKDIKFSEGLLISSEMPHD
jgi:hypothetical protein